METVFFDNFDRDDNSLVGGGWIELQETLASDPEYTGSSSLRVANGQLEINYSAEGITPARLATYKKPFMAHELQSEVGQTGFELEFQFTPGNDERIFLNVGLADSSAGQSIDGVNLVPNSYIGIQLGRSDNLISNSSVAIIRHDGDPTTEERLVLERTSFQFEDSDIIEVSIRIENDGSYLIEVTNGFETNTFQGSIEPITETLDQIVVASRGSISFYGDESETIRIDNLGVKSLSVLEPETPVSTGFRMPIGDRTGLEVTEARENVDGWMDDWYNASDLGDPHPSIVGANHLGEDWNLDDLDGDGVDENDIGQPVFAASSGRVVYVGEFYGASGPSLGLGQTVVIEHLMPDGQTIYSLYAHLEEGSIAVTENQIIENFETQIGAIGQTGAAQDGPHLHFELFTTSGATGIYEAEPWKLAMDEFAYTTDAIGLDVDFHTIDYQNGSVTWYDPSNFIQGNIGFEVNQPVEVAGSNGSDAIFGGSGADNLNGGNGGDEVFGKDGADIISGGGGTDQLFGGAGSDYLLGGKGNDILNGGGDADQIDGGKGDDTIAGGQGNDILVGGEGTDAFVFDLSDASTGYDQILDFSVGDGLVYIGGPTTFDDLSFEQRIDSVVFHYGADVSVSLVGLIAADISESQFTFL